MTVCETSGNFELVADTSHGVSELDAAEMISTIPIGQLLKLLTSKTEGDLNPSEWRLDYRGLICVFLALDRSQVSSDSWTYFPERDLIFGRTHEPKNWSAAMVPHDRVTSLGVEVFTAPDEPFWSWSNDRIAGTVISQLVDIGWLNPAEVCGRWLVRLRHAYPVYDLGYHARLA